MLLSVVGALLAVDVGPLIPSGFTARFSLNNVRDILEILASSMLIVATFSLHRDLRLRGGFIGMLRPGSPSS